MKAIVASLLLLASLKVSAAGIPLDENGFVEAVPGLGPEKVIELLGEPAESITVTDDDSGQIIGVIWQYAYLNTNEDGDYYKATELDWVDNKVVNVVFSNSDLDAHQAQPSADNCTPAC